MFKRLKTVFGINTALAQLGIKTTDLNPVWRQGCQEIALQQGLRPKAVAAFMFYQLPADNRPVEGYIQIERWRLSGDLTPDEAQFASTQQWRG